MGIGLAPLIDDTTDVVPFEDNLDPRKEYKAHIINPPANIHIWKPGMSAQDIVDVARLKGLMVIALCGYQFMPRHNPDQFPACERCMDLAGQIISEDG